MALVPVQPVAKPAIRKKGKSGGGGLGAIVGGLAGAALGSLAVPGAGTAAGAKLGALSGGAALAAGGLGGFAGGSTVGGFLGNQIDPGRQESITRAPASPTIQLSSSEEAQRGQQILDGLRVAQNEPALQGYASNLTEGYIQSMKNLQQRG